MLPAIKSILAGLTPSSLGPKPAETTSPASTSDAVKAQVELKQKQLRRGTTGAKVESLTADLDTARVDLAHATQAHGGAIYEEQDSTAEALAAQQAGNRVAALEAALAIAIQKDADAARALEQAEGDLVIAEREEIHQHLCTMAGEAEELFTRIKLFRAELVRALTALRELGGPNERFGYGSNEIRLHFDHFMALANRPASAAAADSGAFQKYSSWTYCVEVVCGRRQIEYDR